MLITFVALYLFVTVAIGLWAARRVHNSRDYVVAGRSVPLFMSTALVFATWFGAETVLGVSATFLKEGMGGIVADPFGFSFCLVVVALFFARAFYRLNLLTIGDFYRARYNKPVEVAASVCITLSYLGWTSAQLAALGVVFHTLSGGAIPLPWGIVLGTGVVMLYTLFGGMWSVAYTDVFQGVIIIVGLLYLAFLVGGAAGGFGQVVAHAAQAGKFEFWPKPELREVLAFIAAFFTAALGSIPQQDVFQRVTAAKDADTAVRGALLGGLTYFCMAFVPIYLAYCALIIDPKMVGPLLGGEGNESQLILPNLIASHTPVFAQVMFFGALLSAIMSSASGALLAPSTLFTENVLRPFVPHMGERQLLLVMRLVLVIFGLAVMVFALLSDASIYQMVQSAYKVTLVSAFAPLVLGLYWKRSTVDGALFAVVLGLATWVLLEIFAPEALIPPQLVGMAFSFLGMVVGSLYGRQTSRPHAAHPRGY
ncbi:MAG TPA: sodium:solute symporter family protein [Burkholderiales bacterium]|nr:sodium:solute symporter family protein [Burkholderiales bacterium]